MKSNKEFQASIANLCQLLACAGEQIQAGLRMFLLAMFSVFVIGNATGATDDDEPVQL